MAASMCLVTWWCVDSPVITTTPNSTVALRGTDVTLVCKAHGNPAVQFTWFKVSWAYFRMLCAAWDASFNRFSCFDYCVAFLYQNSSQLFQTVIMWNRNRERQNTSRSRSRYPIQTGPTHSRWPMSRTMTLAGTTAESRTVRGSGKWLLTSLSWVRQFLGLDLNAQHRCSEICSENRLSGGKFCFVFIQFIVLCVVTVPPRITELPHKTTMEYGTVIVGCESEGIPAPDIRWWRVGERLPYVDGIQPVSACLLT